MPRKKTKIREARFYTKNGEPRYIVLRRIERQELSRVDKGTVLEKPWVKGGKTVDVELVPPPFTRGYVREELYGDGHGARRSSPGKGKFTKPDPGTRRRQRRVQNAIAKASRKVNR